MKFVLGSNRTTVSDCCSATVRSRYLNEIGEDALAIALKKPSAQTGFVFDKAQVALPTVQTDLDPGASLVLINHTSRSVSIDDRDEYIIDSVIDCHPLDLQTKASVFMLGAPVGSVCTVIAQYFLDKVYVPDVGHTVLLLAGIIVDTKNFALEYTTEEDEEAFSWLKELIDTTLLDQFVTDLLEISE